MLQMSTDLQVNQPIVEIIGDKFIRIDNYISIEEFENETITVKTKIKKVRILGDNLLIKFINESEIGITGVVKSIEFF
ncbi:MAG: YabP/YqfC family sporulation protein [Clostridioides sp.]|nr:YabP/YqfC family sporulation protein [Clostridioides sp.]